MSTRVITAHVPDKIAKKLDGLAGRLERPRGWLVKEAIAAYIALEEERYRQTKAALAEASAGRTVDHAEIEAWANALDAPGSRNILREKCAGLSLQNMKSGMRSPRKILSCCESFTLVKIDRAATESRRLR